MSAVRSSLICPRPEDVEAWQKTWAEKYASRWRAVDTCRSANLFPRTQAQVREMESTRVLRELEQQIAGHVPMMTLVPEK